jgi:hypothetical protein
MFRNTFILLLVLSLFSCHDDEKKTGDLNLRFHLLYDGQPMEMFAKYPYPGTNEPFYLTRLSFYLSDVSIKNTKESQLIKDIDFLNMTAAFTGSYPQDGYVYKIAGVPQGEYTTLNFGIGVPKALNAKSPNQYPAGSILSSPTEYWESWKSYVFFKTEGSILFVNNAPAETDFALHLGGDEAYRMISLSKSISVKGDKVTNVDINLDIKKYFDGIKTYDIHDTQKIHSLYQMPLINTLMDNLVTAFE